MARKSQRLTEEALKIVAARFRCLGDPSRLKLLNLLMDGEMSVGDLADAAEFDQPTVSRQLAILRREGIVSRRSEGNRGFYRIVDATVVELCEVVCGGLIDQLTETLEALPDERAWRGMNI